MLVPPRFLQDWTSLISNLNGLGPRCSKGILPDPRLELVAPLQTSPGAGEGRVQRGLAASGGQTRETSAWKLEERRALGLTRVSMDTCVLHVAPLLPPHGCWDLELQPRTPCRCQRRHFRRSSACTSPLRKQ